MARPIQQEISDLGPGQDNRHQGTYTNQAASPPIATDMSHPCLQHALLSAKSFTSLREASEERTIQQDVCK
jgi:hypothetical protein